MLKERNLKHALFIKEPVKQRYILKATQKIKNKDQANTKTEPTTRIEDRGLKLRISNQEKIRHFLMLKSINEKL